MSFEEDNSFDDDEIQNSFWGVEVVPGKEFTTTAPYDLHLTQVVLPFAAKDTGRSVVSVKLQDKAFALASLKLNGTESQSLDVLFDAGEEITFTVEGKNPVHLVGYYVPPQDLDEDDFDDEIPSDEDEDEAEYRKALGLDGEEDDEEDDEEEDEEEVDDEELDNQIRAKIVAQQQGKRKADAQPQQQQKKQKTEASPQQAKQQQPKTPQQQNNNKAATPKSAGQQQQQQKGGQQQQQQKVTKVSGMEIHTLKESLSKETAVPGTKVSMRYIGKLPNGKTFDSNTSGKPFAFSLGAGEVIKGWDIGVAGMKVGEKRKLIIPPNLAYGNQKIPGIPPGSTLHFDVELVGVNRR